MSAVLQRVAIRDQARAFPVQRVFSAEHVHSSKNRSCAPLTGWLMAKTDSPAASWDPSAYILRGQHCPAGAIRETLTSAMHALGASRLVHIAFYESSIIGSLSFTVGFPKAIGNKIDGLLARAPGRTGSESLVDDCSKTVRALASESILQRETVYGLAVGITRLRLRNLALTNYEARDFVARIRSGMYLTHTGRSGISPSSGDIQSLVLIDIAPVSKSLLHRTNLAQTLAMQLKSTAEASALSDNMVMRIVADRLHRQERPGSTASFDEQASHALELALEVTNSKAGAIYLFSARAGQPFDCLVSRGSAAFPSRIEREQASLLTAVVNDNVAVQRDHWPLAENSRTRGAPNGASLLSPIGGPGIDPWRSAVGILVLCREDQHDAFNAYDLALTRNVALRISLARTTDVMSRIGTVTSELRARTDWAQLADDVKRDASGRVIGHPVIPTDIRIVSKLIRPVLATLANITDSLSVSLRVALPTEEAVQPHGLALIRVACHPEASPSGQNETQTEDRGGFNWACMHMGQAIYAADVSEHPEYLRERPETVSELTMPVRLEGTLVGVLNLESSLYDAYDTLRPLIASFCGAVGRTLADARAALEQEVIDDAAQALNHRHTMSSQLDRLKVEIAKLDLADVIRDSLILKVKDIQAELDAMRHVSFEEDEKISTLSAILERAADKASYTGELPGMQNPRFMAPINGFRSRALEVSISNVLSNLVNHTKGSVNQADGTPLREVTVAAVQLGGTDNVVLRFQNHTSSHADPQRIANLYRWPIQDNSGRLRVGGFLAGLGARRANARLQSTVLADGRTVRTTLIIPVGGPEDHA
jgi:GAF domain-containing protein